MAVMIWRQNVPPRPPPPPAPLTLSCRWAFLETLGYFTFLGMLLVQCSSYRAELAMCLLTVISISLLCYVVSDLDSPFHGFFRVDLRRFGSLVQQLDNVFHSAAGDTVLERSFSVTTADTALDSSSSADGADSMVGRSVDSAISDTMLEETSFAE